MDFDNTNWSDAADFFGQNRRNYTIAETKITEDILNTGIVAVYVKFGGTSTNIQPLPVTQAITQIKNQTLGHYLRQNQIILFFYNQDDTLDPGVISSGNSFRYVIIPGGTLSSGRIADIDLMDYEAVKVHYNIPD